DGLRLHARRPRPAHAVRRDRARLRAGRPEGAHRGADRGAAGRRARRGRRRSRRVTEARVRDAVIVAAARTPIGRSFKGGLAGERPDDLLAVALRAVLDRAPGLDPVDVEDVLVGCAFPEQRQGMNVARRSALLAGYPVTVPGATITRFCASSLQAIRMAFHAI